MSLADDAPGNARRGNSGHSGVHESRTGERQVGRQTFGHMGIRLLAFRNALRKTDVSWRDADGHSSVGCAWRAGLGRLARGHTTSNCFVESSLPDEGREATATRYW